MNINITVLQVTKETKPTAKGSYQQLTVDYKNLSSGKVESKKLMSFASPDAFNALVDAKQGATYAVVAEKNEKSGYWDWVAVSQNAPSLNQDTPTKVSTSTPVRSTYETPEERAKKQVYIVKQSSLANAITLLSTGAKTPPKEDEVLVVAQKFTDWVFSSEQAPQAAETLTDMSDDIPF